MIAFYPRLAAKPPVNRIEDRFTLLKPFPVNVVEGNLTVPQSRGTHTVPQHIPGKNGTARTHKRNLCHSNLP
jgi:hypothetical protein